LSSHDRNATPPEVARVFVHTFGCQMNVYDSERMLQVLTESSGRTRYEATKDPSQADVILINTCSVREKPFVKVRHTVGRYAQLRKARPSLVIGVMGCVAAQEGERLLEREPAPDLVVGPDHVARLPELLEKIRERRRPIVQSDELSVDGYAFVPGRPLANQGIFAMVTAMKGCDNFCTYCIVPYVRGREVSKPMAEVVAEVERFLGAGAREIMLLGQNVNRFGLDLPDGDDFPTLIRRVGRLPGLERLRFTTSHPKDCSDELIACFGEVPSLCEYFHLPFQSGSDAILSRMRRGYDRARYLDRATRLRERCPDIHLSADVIVGFPGETDADFEQTMDVLDRVRFGSLFSFKYSPRPGTAALRFGDDVPPDVKSRRLQVLQDFQATVTEEVLKEHEGREVQVLIEGPSRSSRKEGVFQVMGRTRSNFIVNFAPGQEQSPDALTGRLAHVRIDRALGHSLAGSLLDVEAQGK